MQRRLELASALVHDPDLMFLDGPSAGIDPILRTSIWHELHRLRNGGRTLLVTTQYVNEAEECDTVALISAGRLIALADPDDVRREAVGGDAVEIELGSVYDSARLSELALVRSVERRGPNTLKVTVDDASIALPEVVEAITGSGGDVTVAREVRPSFDEVFAILVERDRLARLHTEPSVDA